MIPLISIGNNISNNSLKEDLFGVPFWRIAECIEIVSLNFQIEGLKIKKDNKRVEQISLCGEFDQSILIIYRLFIDLRIDYCDLFKD